MLIKTRQTIILFVAVYSLLNASIVNADELGSFGSSVFQFQKKLASKGNTIAEYKLGTFYEFGISVAPDVNEASAYYKKAAKKGYTPAVNRLTYLEIKHSGYDKSRHESWFKKLNSQASSSEPNALILLGQMHRHGINVSKNLNKSLAMLQKASSLGHTEVDSEIDEIYREIEAKTEQAEKARIEDRAKQVKQPKKVVAKPVAKVKSKTKSAPKTVTAKSKSALSKEAKRRKYEEAMRKLHQENLILQQQQEWSEAGDE